MPADSHRHWVSHAAALSPRFLLSAYTQGYFPMGDAWGVHGKRMRTKPIYWCNPDPRCVLYPKELYVSRSLGKSLRNRGYAVTIDACFERVISMCRYSGIRGFSDESWITDDIQKAFYLLHDLGFVHSVETWLDSSLVGGLYGISLGRVFIGESMFSASTDASKVAFCHLATMLAEWGYVMIDCQVETPLLTNMGARLISRRQFSAALEDGLRQAAPPEAWQLGGPRRSSPDDTPKARGWNDARDLVKYYTIEPWHDLAKAIKPHSGLFDVPKAEGRLIVKKFSDLFRHAKKIEKRLRSDSKLIPVDKLMEYIERGLDDLKGFEGGMTDEFSMLWSYFCALDVDLGSNPTDPEIGYCLLRAKIGIGNQGYFTDVRLT